MTKGLEKQPPPPKGGTPFSKGDFLFSFICPMLVDGSLQK